MAALLPTDAGADGPAWVRVVGPLGSGKSTILRMIAADAQSTRPVIALQLQQDNSDGYASVGATEYFDAAPFRRRVEEVATTRPSAQPLLIIDGLGPTEPQELAGWVSALPDTGAMQIVCATNRDDITMSPSWGPPAITLRLDSQRLRGLATGTIQRLTDPHPYYWEMPLVTQPMVGMSEV